VPCAEAWCFAPKPGALRLYTGSEERFFAALDPTLKKKTVGNLKNAKDVSNEVESVATEGLVLCEGHPLISD
jgi:hypothetical protein